MERTAKNLINIAISQIGYHEKESCNNLDNNTANAGDANHTKYARDLHDAGYYNNHDKCGYAWCDVFADWCFYMLCDKNAVEAQKMSYQTGPYGAGCKYSAQYYKNAKRYYTSNPMPGDQIFFASDGNINHTGIVETVNGNIITTIEGNTSNKVARRTYNLTNKYIVGFGRPNYSNVSSSNNSTNVTTPSVNNSTNSDNGLVNGVYTVKPRDTWWGIAAKYLGSGAKMNELATYNGKTTKTMLHPGDTIKIPGKYTGSNTTVTKPSNNTNNSKVTGWDKDAGTYTVQKGDGWWKIAAKTMGSGIKMHTLAKYNGMTILTMLHPNDVIKIPK